MSIQISIRIILYIYLSIFKKKLFITTKGEKCDFIKFFYKFVVFFQFYFIAFSYYNFIVQNSRFQYKILNRSYFKRLFTVYLQLVNFEKVNQYTNPDLSSQSDFIPQSGFILPSGFILLIRITVIPQHVCALREGVN